MIDVPERLKDKLESLKPQALAAVEAAEIAIAARRVLRNVADPAFVPRDPGPFAAVGLSFTREQAAQHASGMLRDAYAAVNGFGQEVLRLLQSHFSTDGQPGRKLLQDLMAAALGTGGVCWALPVADSDLAGAVVRLRDAVEGLKNATQPPPPSAAERRNALMYRRHQEGKTLKEIRAEVNERADNEGWEALDAIQSVKAAIDRHAKEKGLPTAPRKRGRPTKQK